MPKYNIVVFGGDYAGPEVTVEAVKVSLLSTTYRAVEGLLSCLLYLLKHTCCLPVHTAHMLGALAGMWGLFQAV